MHTAIGNPTFWHLLGAQHWTPGAWIGLQTTHEAVLLCLIVVIKKRNQPTTTWAVSWRIGSAITEENWKMIVATIKAQIIPLSWKENGQNTRTLYWKSHLILNFFFNHFSNHLNVVGNELKETVKTQLIGLFINTRIISTKQTLRRLTCSQNQTSYQILLKWIGLRLLYLILQWKTGGYLPSKITKILIKTFKQVSQKSGWMW